MFVHIGVNNLFRGNNLRGKDVKKNDLQMKGVFLSMLTYFLMKRKRGESCTACSSVYIVAIETITHKNQLSSVVI